ncbi:DUF4258 domain-containing protein [Desulfofundulus thermobenzoicus]|uniref:DUF4258 domain-containing protein n=1 Tax=Desulfofundulus thermobenzoicus TaxID=29376 RepID=UPI003C12C66F
MKIYFSRHAKNRMHRFKISNTEVITAIENAFLTEESIKKRKNAWSKRNGNYLRVTYSQENLHEIIVITVTLKKNGPKGDLT